MHCGSPKMHVLLAIYSMQPLSDVSCYQQRVLVYAHDNSMLYLYVYFYLWLGNIGSQQTAIRFILHIFSNSLNFYRRFPKIFMFTFTFYISILLGFYLPRCILLLSFKLCNNLIDLTRTSLIQTVAHCRIFVAEK